MRRRARDLTTRARERIRAAREHDPHAWNHPNGNVGPEPIDFVEVPPDEEDEPAEGATRPPLGSPEPGGPMSPAASAAGASAARPTAAGRSVRPSGASGRLPRAGPAPKTTSPSACGRRQPGPGG